MSLLQSRLGLSVCQRMSLWRSFPNKSLKGWSPSCCINRRETFIPHNKLSTRTSLIPYRFLSGTLLSRNLSSFSRNVLSCKIVDVKFRTIDNKSVRFKSSVPSGWRQRNRTVMMYVLAGAILVVGFSYAAVPLYTVFCQATGLGGEVQIGQDADKVGSMSPVAGRPLVIRFNADTAASMRWNFKPQQTEIKVFPGETALAFYSAINPTDKPIIGISTYNVVPFDAGQYFNKIQCFCFEEQRLNPHEQVDMPVFFYIDPEFAEDPKMGKVDSITLSYTFFEAKEGLVLPDPYAKA